MWKPDYQHAVCERLGKAAGYLREEGPLHRRRRLAQAALAIHVLREDEFPADFWADFHAILTRVTRAGTIEETIQRMSEEDVTEVSAMVVQFYEEVCCG